MGLYNCLGSGGGKTLEETVLWTNSSPTANTFASQYVTLSDDITNYDFIEIAFKGYYSGTTTLKFRLPVTEWVHCNSSTAQSTDLYLGSSSSANGMCRSVAYSSNTVVAFGTTQYRGASGSNNSYCIPLQISGLKYLDEVKEWSPSIAILGTSSTVARAASLSMTLTLPSTGIYRIYPVVAYASGSNPYTASMRNPNSCTFTGATVLSQNGNNYTINATSTSVKITMATGTTASTSFNMVARVFQLLEN